MPEVNTNLSQTFRTIEKSTPLLIDEGPKPVGDSRNMRAKMDKIKYFFVGASASQQNLTIYEPSQT